MNSHGLLQNIYLFKTLNAEELEIISGIVEAKPFAAGDTIFLKGEPARALYLIKSGSIKIQQSAKSGDAIDVAVLGSGSHFGEMSFVDNQLRSASAVASDRGEMINVPYEKLAVVLKQNVQISVKVYRELAHFLAGRLRSTTNDLSYAREKNLMHF